MCMIWVLVDANSDCISGDYVFVIGGSTKRCRSYDQDTRFCDAGKSSLCDLGHVVGWTNGGKICGGLNSTTSSRRVGRRVREQE